MSVDKITIASKEVKSSGMTDVLAYIIQLLEEIRDLLKPVE